MTLIPFLQFTFLPVDAAKGYTLFFFFLQDKDTFDSEKS